MSINLHARSLLTLLDFSATEIDYLLKLALDLKTKKHVNKQGHLLTGKNIVLIFDKPSTRTRCAFETAVHDENGHITYLANSHMGYKESLEDTAKVLGCFYDGIGYRGYQHKDIEILAQYAGIPVWNGLTNGDHPTQALADLMTIREHSNKPLHKIKLVYTGNTSNNVAYALMIAAAKMGMHFVGLAPRVLWPKKELITKIQNNTEKTGGTFHFTDNIAKAVVDADVIYTDVWVSMGEEVLFAQYIKLLQPYQVNQCMLEKTGNNNIVFMHCLPACHDLHSQFTQKIQQQYGLTEMEVTDEVFRSRHSIVFEQAQNRLHTIKAVIVATIGNVNPFHFN